MKVIVEFVDDFVTQFKVTDHDVPVGNPDSVNDILSLSINVFFYIDTIILSHNTSI